MTVDRDTLESERGFLLRSLDDLEAERAAGNIDDDTYRTLHDDYTARAASVIRSLQDGTPAVGSGGPRRIRFVTAFAVVLFAVAAAFALTRAVGTREPGQAITGNDQTAEEDVSLLDSLQAAAEAQPDSYDARIAYARGLLGTDLAAASREYVAARDLDPDQPEPPAYIGWIAAQAGGQLEGAERDAVLADALAWFDRALELDPDYQDAYVFRGIVKLNFLGDAGGAVPDFQQFLVLAGPDHPMRDTVLGALERAVEQSSPTTNGGP